MQKRIAHALAATVIGVFIALASEPSVAAPTTYIFEQTSSSIAGFHATGTIVIDGGFADLPTIIESSGDPGPYDFGSLLSFSFSPQGQTFTLANFTPPFSHGSPLIPSWDITPGGILFNDQNSDFAVSFVGGPMHYNTDRPGLCGETGTCSGTGIWVPVPEPSGLAIFGAGALCLLGFGMIKRRMLA